MLFIQELQHDPRYYFAVIIAVVVSICLHELAHGIVAVKLGDDTPIEEGRMTLNPLVHMGPVSLLVLLISGIAWGSMPIDRRRLRGKYGEAQVAAAGPFMNVVIAAVVLTALGLWQRYRDVPTSELSQMAQNGEYLLWVFGMMNVCLALFNLVPCPPLDGAHIVANFSDSFARTLDGMMQTGMYFRFAIILFAVGGYVIFPFGQKLALSYLLWVRGEHAGAAWGS
jgi:Zn-dependent protease